MDVKETSDDPSCSENFDSLRCLNEERIMRALKASYIEWFCRLMETEADCDNFMSVLDNGVLLCQYADKIQRAGAEYFQKNPSDSQAASFPKKRIKFKANNVSSGSFVARDNICNFLVFCRETGMPDYLLFETEDLVLHRNEKSIMCSLLELNHLAEKFGVEPPQVEPELEIEEEIVEEPEEIVKPAQRVPFDPVSQALDYLIFKEVYRCTCPSQFHVEKVMEGRYRFGESSKTVYAKLMRAQVILRIGGGWNTLDKHLNRLDPCRQETPPPGIRWKKAVNKLSDMKLTAMQFVSTEDAREASGMKQSFSSSSICSYDGSSDSSTTSGTTVVKQKPQKKVSARSTSVPRPRRDSTSESEPRYEPPRRKAYTPTLQRKSVTGQPDRYAATPPARHRDITKIRSGSLPASRTNTPSPQITRAAVRKSSTSDDIRGRRKDSLSATPTASPLNIRRSKSFSDKDFVSRNIKLSRSSSERLQSKPDHVPEKRVTPARKASTPNPPRKFSTPTPRRASVDVTRSSKSPASVTNTRIPKKITTPRDSAKKTPQTTPKKLPSKSERKASIGSKGSVESLDMIDDRIMNGRTNSFASTVSSASESVVDMDRLPASDSGYSLDEVLSRSGDESLSSDSQIMKLKELNDCAYKVGENKTLRHGTPEADAELTDSSDVSSSKSSIKELILTECGEDSGLDKSLNK